MILLISTSFSYSQLEGASADQGLMLQSIWIRSAESFPDFTSIDMTCIQTKYANTTYTAPHMFWLLPEMGV